MLCRQESGRGSTDSLLSKGFIFAVLNYESVCVCVCVCVHVRAGALGSQEASHPAELGLQAVVRHSVRTRGLKFGSA